MTNNKAYNDDGKCGNENSEAFKRNENNKTLFGSDIRIKELTSIINGL